MLLCSVSVPQVTFTLRRHLMPVDAIGMYAHEFQLPAASLDRQTIIFLLPNEFGIEDLSKFRFGTGLTTCGHRLWNPKLI